MGRPKIYKFPANMTFDRQKEKYAVRNPISGKKKLFADLRKATEAAERLNEWLDCERQRQALDAGRPTIAALVDYWKKDRLPFMPWDEGTRDGWMFKVERIRRELGNRTIKHTDCLFIQDWMAFCGTADQWNKWRHAWFLLWDFAVSRKLADTNEPEKIQERSTSKKLAINQKVRQQLDVAGFKAIHDHEATPGWLQLAMEQSLVTLQARTEICRMRHADYRGGYLFVIRDKTSGDSDMAFIKIALTPELEDIRGRALKLDGIASPFLIHRAPRRQRRQWTEGKPHWTFINPGYLSKAFELARDASRHYADLKPKQRPTFHEIRGLGSRLYRAQGVPERDIQALMTHAHARTTQIYLERGASALTDDDYVAVTAPMTLNSVWSKT